MISACWWASDTDRIDVPPAPDDIVTNDQRAETIDRYLSRLVPFGFSGSVLVSRKGEVILRRGYGLAIDDPPTPNTGATVHSIGSVTKQFTATAILKLQQAGQLTVEDSIADHLEDVPADKRKVTIHHLLTHTSGVHPLSKPDDEPAERTATVEAILEQPLVFEPGTYFAYSNAGYTLLAAIVERLSGRKYEEFVVEELLHPAGLRRTGYRAPDWSREVVAHAYRAGKDHGSNPEQSETAWPSWHVMGNGEMLSTVDDLLAWHRALEDDEILDPQSKRMMYTPEMRDYAYGWDVRKTKHGRRISHDGGSTVGTGCEYRRFVDSDSVIVLFSNRDSESLFFPAGVADRVEEILFGAEVELPPAVTDTVDPGHERFSGNFELSKGNSVEVTPRGGTLRLVATGLDAAQLLLFDTEERERVKDLIQRSEDALSYVLTGDFSAFERELPEEDRRVRYKSYLDGNRHAVEAEIGPCQSVRAAVAVPVRRDFADLVVTVRVGGENGGVFLQIYWNGDRLAAIGGADEPPAVALWAAPTGKEGAFLGYEPASGVRRPLQFSADGDELSIAGESDAALVRSR